MCVAHALDGIEDPPVFEFYRRGRAERSRAIVQKKKEIKDDEWKILLGLSNGSAALTPRRIIVELATRVLSGTVITTILSRALFGGAGVSIGALRLNVVVVRFLRDNLSPDELRINV
jgi:hypothetical protein